MNNVDALKDRLSIILEDIANMTEEMQLLVKDLDSAQDPEFITITKEHLRGLLAEYDEVVADSIIKVDHYLKECEKYGMPVDITYYSISKILKGYKFKSKT